MLFSTPLILVALSAGMTYARPSAHQHRHQQFHDAQKRKVGDMVVAVIDGQTVSWLNEYAGSTAEAIQTGGVAPPVLSVSPSTTATSFSTATTLLTTPTTTSTPPPAPTITSTSTTTPAPAPSTTSSADTAAYTAFCSKKKRATLADIASTGNVGCDGVYGSNFKLVDGSVADKYDYTVEFTGKNTEDYACACWNKIGSDGGINGWFDPPFHWTQSPGATTYVAIDGNSQGGCGCGLGSTLPTDSIGQPAVAWLEFDMGSTRNSGWSGADASILVPGAAGIKVPGLHVCGSGVCSTTNADGTGDNAYLVGMETADGVGLNLPAGQVRLTAVIDY